MPIRDYSQTAASNTAISSINIGEGCPPSNINDAIRQALADIREVQASSTIASASTVNIGAANAEYLAVSGTTTITAFDSVAAGVYRVLKFDGALTLTHNATSLILPGGASITTAANDVGGFRSLGSGNWRCEWYSKASGLPTSTTFPTVDINGGTIDGAIIGGASAAAGTFTTATVGAGLVGTPSLTTTGDTNTGLYFPAADTIAATTGGTERMRIDSSGNVGIGTSSPNVLLNLAGSSTTALARIANTGNGAGAFDGSGAGLELLATGMNSGANKYAPAIKFGSTDADFTTTNPKYGAAIVGTAAQSYSSDTTGGMNLEFWTAPASPGTGSGLVERMRIDSAGNVGIATTSPSSFGKFAVQGASTTRAFYADALAQPVARYDDNSYVSNGLTIRNTGVAGSNQGIGLLFQLGAGGTAVDSGAIQMRSEADYSTAANQDAAMLFFTVANGTNSERMRINSSGNVGIGTSAPVDLLQVNRGSGSGITSGISLSTAAGGVGDGSYLKWTGAGTNEKIARIDGVQEGTDIGSIRFNTGNGADDFAERMRIDASGNVRIGTAALATTATDGFLYVPTCAGTPTGTPTAITGLAPIVVNTTNNKLYFYSGGAWRDAGP